MVLVDLSCVLYVGFDSVPTFGCDVANDWSPVILEAETGNLVSSMAFNSLSKSVLSQVSVIAGYFFDKRKKEKKKKENNEKFFFFLFLFLASQIPPSPPPSLSPVFVLWRACVWTQFLQALYQQVLNHVYMQLWYISK